MRLTWDDELAFIRRFAVNLESRMPLPEASSTELAQHADEIAHLQDLLGHVAGLPAHQRPPLALWDDHIFPLWRILFRKGDDVDRYILADLWRTALLEGGEITRYLSATAAAGASARNFFLFEEALEKCREAREACGSNPSAGLVSILNLEGSINLCLHDYDRAEGLFRKLLEVGLAVPEADLLRYSGLSRADLLATEALNVLDCHLKRGHESASEERQRWVTEARKSLREFDGMPCSEGILKVASAHRAEVDILEGRYAEAKATLVADFDTDAHDGPFQYSLSPVHLRLLSMVASAQGDWQEAYGWTRMALKQVSRRCYPMEEQFILEQGLSVIRGFQACADTNSREMIVQDLAQLLEDKDWYTGRSHSRNVASLAVRLGEVLNAAGKGWSLDLSKLRYGGLLHDLGKLSIPWSLLNKIAPISRRERALLEEHPARGASLLHQLGMDDIVPTVEMHHEHVDGSGYPRGTRPEPHAAVIAACDVFEASITANRRYKEPKSPGEALQEIVAGAGNRYHGDVVEALVQTARPD